MEENVKNICYDRDFKLEAYSFNGIVQPFPNHIHDYYVAGIVEKACRFMKTEYGRQITLDDYARFQCSENQHFSVILQKRKELRLTNICSR